MGNESEIRKEIFRLLGVQDDAEGERIVRSIGEHALAMQRLKDEATKQGVRRGVATLFNILKYLVLGAVFYTLWKLDLVPKK